MLEWGTLLVCGVALLVRAPDALRGHNRSVFGILLLAMLCSVLSIPGPYLAIDQALGGRNLTNLILRYIVFGMVFMVGLRLATGLGDSDARRLLTGRPGRWGLAAACVAVGLAFWLMDTQGSSVGLLETADTARNAALGPFYAAAGRSYPAFVSVLLLPALLRTVRAPFPRLVRAGAAATLTGSVAAVLSVPASFAPDGWEPAQLVVNFAAVLGYVLGLLVFWISGKRGQLRR
ncbi:hypothetical protein ACTWLI_02870 [Arthrobacter sp. Hor0625]|uniref:hypothetical protein n=1 Tax=Arthrobacter sp. Hor0625 TaxID=3457358 RepID=UPI00403E4239